jgi:putative hydrolase
MQYDNHTTSTHGQINVNHLVADRLLEAAQILSKKRANQFRVRAYRSAAKTVENLNVSLVDIIERDGVLGLIKLPYIGKSIAYSIYELVATGRWKLLERLRASLAPPNVFEVIPGIGPVLAKQIYTILKVKTLEELETAAYAGRLAEIPGFGERRQSMIRESLTSMLSDNRRIYHLVRNGPSVDALLRVDRIYRKKAQQGSLKTVAPIRFNPSGESWLPIFHYEENNWQFTAMFSNTERVHRLHKLKDWVIVLAYDPEHHEYQRTIVTETTGPLKGRRVVRGHELKCVQFYKPKRD